MSEKKPKAAISFTTAISPNENRNREDLSSVPTLSACQPEFDLISTSFQRHPHTVFWSQRQKRLRLYFMIADESHTPPSGERRKQQHARRSRKPFANATSRSRAKRKVGELRP